MSVEEAAYADSGFSNLDISTINTIDLFTQKFVVAQMIKTSFLVVKPGLTAPLRKITFVHVHTHALTGDSFTSGSLQIAPRTPEKDRQNAKLIVVAAQICLFC